MSVSLGKQTNIVPTVLGSAAVTTEYLVGYDVEDVIRAKAESQARQIQMVTIGRDVIPSTFDTGALPSIYTDVTEDLENG